MNIPRAITSTDSEGKIRNFTPGSAVRTVELEEPAVESAYSFISVVPEETTFSSGTRNDVLPYETKSLDTGGYQTRQQTGLERVSAVVSKVDAEEVILTCSLPHENVEVALPKDLVPGDLAKYGTPVFLSLEIINGYKTPCVKRREVAITQGNNPFADIEAWLQQP